MTARRKLSILLLMSFIAWASVMGHMWHTYYVENVDPELAYFAPDITFEAGTREYYGIFHNDTRVGYKSEALLYYERVLLFVEDTSINLNFAAMSREIFTQCSVAIDSIAFTTPFIDYTINSGSHAYHSRGMVRSDSLIIEVKTDSFEPWRKGVFTVEPDVIFSVGLPYFLSRMEGDTFTRQVFDPFISELYTITATRDGTGSVTVGDTEVAATRYRIRSPLGENIMWLSDSGKLLRSDGVSVLSGQLGPMMTEKAVDRNVFLLPIEVSLGSDFIHDFSVTPDTPIENPRDVEYLEIQLDGIRAANLDFRASNKDFLSYNPVQIAVQRNPILSDTSRKQQLAFVPADTSVVSHSDYIQSNEARLRRFARQIARADDDTLAVAATICEWVHANMTRDEDLRMVRSSDIFRNLRGGHEEYTKLSTALTRSVGIPTQINLGLVYENGAFVYHSWPSVFVDGLWHDMDPFYGQERADATHISLFRGDFDRLIELIRLFGRFDITLLDYR